MNSDDIVDHEDLVAALDLLGPCGSTGSKGSYNWLLGVLNKYASEQAKEAIRALS